MARPSRLKCTKNELKKYILNFLVTDKGKRRSIRDLIVSEDFIKFSGLAPSPDKTTGTITYYLKMLKIDEKSVYQFAIDTGRIGINTRFEDFQLAKDKKGKSIHVIIDGDDIKTSELSKWRKVAKVLGIDYNIDGLGLKDFKNLCYAMGYTDDDLQNAMK